MKEPAGIIVTFSDGTRWKVPLQYVAENRATHYCEKFYEGSDPDNNNELYNDIYTDTMTNQYHAMSWASHMTWQEVKDVAYQIASLEYETNYDKEWPFAEMSVVGVD